MREQALKDARLMVRKADVGVVSTISQNLRGYPFGSVTPFMTDSQGKVYFYISDIAQHAKNLHKDSKLSLTIYNQAENGDQNETGRVTIVGDAKPVAESEQATMLAKYVARFPSAQSYMKAHDFKMWQMDVVRVRYIGGFGKIFWLEQEEWNQSKEPWEAQVETGVIEHMNEDHRDAMSIILHDMYGVNDDSPEMTGLLVDGCYFNSNQKSYFIPFANETTSSQDIRKELVALTHKAREAA